MRWEDSRILMWFPFILGGIIGVASLLNEKMFGVSMRFQRHWNKVYFSGEKFMREAVNNWWKMSPSPVEAVGGVVLVVVVVGMLWMERKAEADHPI